MTESLNFIPTQVSTFLHVNHILIDRERILKAENKRDFGGLYLKSLVLYLLDLIPAT